MAQGRGSGDLRIRNMRFAMDERARVRDRMEHEQQEAAGQVVHPTWGECFTITRFLAEVLGPEGFTAWAQPIQRSGADMRPVFEAKLFEVTGTKPRDPHMAWASMSEEAWRKALAEAKA